MTWRAFIIGLVAVAAFSLMDPYAAFIHNYGGVFSTSWPAAPVLTLVLLSAGANVLVKLVRKRWALSRAELMLVWCMLISAATVPSYGIGRFLCSYIAGPPYQSRRADVSWYDGGSMSHAPAGLLLSKDSHSEAVRLYNEGSRGEVGVPWRLWVRPLAWWAALLLPFYLAVFLLCAILRRQWVEVERLQFPLARVPMDFAEGAEGPGLLPSLFRNRAFQTGLVVAVAFRFVRALPLFFGAERSWEMVVPLREVFADTPLATAAFESVPIWPYVVGFAYLVPADVSLSVWLFFLFGRAELVVGNWLALPSARGEYGPLMQWQQAGAYVAFAAGLLFLSRRHLAAVARKALGLAGADDAGEPVSYRVAFWGFCISIGACLAWYWHFGVSLREAAAMLFVMFLTYFVYARAVAQSGVHVVRPVWTPHNFLHGLTGGHLFGGPGAVISTMQSTLLVTGGSVALAPMAMGSLRISEVFERRRRWLVPALMAAIVLALACMCHTVLTQAYRHGALNFEDPWGQQDVPFGSFAQANAMILQPTQSAQRDLGAFTFGAVAMGFLTFMRAHFYWWPVHSIGLLTIAGFHAQRLYIPFFLGWLTKVLVLKFGGGRRLSAGRHFFVALIMVEGFADGLCPVLRTLTRGAVPFF